MGVHNNITAERLPKQSVHVGEPVKVAFHYDTKRTFDGVIVRDDWEEPWETIIKLDNGFYVRASECQYSHQKG